LTSPPLRRWKLGIGSLGDPVIVDDPERFPSSDL
jgi:hypothetical protein